MDSHNTTPSLILLTCVLVSFSGTAGGSDSSTLEPAPITTQITPGRLGYTVSPYTVGAGEVQFETDLLNYTYFDESDRGVDQRIDTYRWNPTLRLGVTDRLEYQFGMTLRHTEARYHVQALGRTFRDETTQVDVMRHALKFNLTGNDDGPLTIAIVPEIQNPVRYFFDFGAGITIPMAYRFSDDWEARLHSGFAVRRGRDNYYANENGLNISRKVSEKLTVFGEVIGGFTGRGKLDDFDGSVGGGAAYLLAPNFQIDAGLHYQFSDHGEPINPFIGVSWKPEALQRSPASATRAENESVYWLFNPTPSDELRDMASLRLGSTATPYTVNPGRVYLENTFSYSHLEQTRPLGFYSPGTYSHRTWDMVAVTPTIRIGLTERIEVNTTLDYIFYETHETVRTPFGAPLFRSESRGDYLDAISPGLKINLIGNDNERFALALAPFVRIPEKGVGRLATGGLLVPFSVNLPADWEVRVASGFTSRFPGSAFDGDFIVHNSLNVSKKITSSLTAYSEFVTAVYPHSRSWSRTVDWTGEIGAGVAYEFCPRFQVDVGSHFGVTRDIADYRPFVAVSLRF